MRSVLIIVRSDPRLNGRPAEAIRMAAGIAVWRKARVQLLLQGASAGVLGEFADELVHGDTITRFLPMLVESSGPVLVDAGLRGCDVAGLASVPCKEVTADEIAAIASDCDAVFTY